MTSISLPHSRSLSVSRTHKMSECVQMQVQMQRQRQVDFWELALGLGILWSMDVACRTNGIKAARPGPTSLTPFARLARLAHLAHLALHVAHCPSFFAHVARCLG